ncbi:MAG: hypothetical protein K2M19_01085 [Muribaculaceae bacterium]|nr:hypothetical protein [Muribaculaceae bacterium]
MPDTLDQLKKQWQELNLRTTRLEEANNELSQRLARGHVTSTQQRLARDTRRWGIAGFLLVLLAIPLVHTFSMPWWVGVVYAAFGILMAILNFNLSAFIERERLVDLPVTQAYERACRIRHRQFLCRVTGIICGSLVIAMLFYYFWLQNDIIIIYSFAGGLIIGLSLGISKAYRQNRMSRQLIDDFKD